MPDFNQKEQSPSLENLAPAVKEVILAVDSMDPETQDLLLVELMSFLKSKRENQVQCHIEELEYAKAKCETLITIHQKVFSKN